MGTEGSGASRGAAGDFHNEDVFLVEDGLGLYVVCDGDSQRPAGEAAAQLAAEALEEFVARAEAEWGAEIWQGAHAERVVERGLQHALSAVLRSGSDDPELSGMTTSVTMLLARGHRGVLGHSGDSRAYLFRNDRAHQLTLDSDWTDALSSETGDHPAATAFSIGLRPGDRLVLCTDGAEEVVAEPAIVRGSAGLSPALLASRIVSAAHRRNPEVDATAVVVRVRGDDERGWLDLSGPPRRHAFGHTLSRA